MKNPKTELLLAPDRLCDLVARLSAHVERFKQIVISHGAASEVDGQSSGLLNQDAGSEVSSTELAQKLHRERLQLIDAWADLESEQRRNRLQCAVPSVKSNVAPPQQATQAVPLQGTQRSMDRKQQFQFLQRECDRNRD